MELPSLRTRICALPIVLTGRISCDRKLTRLFLRTTWKRNLAVSYLACYFFLDIPIKWPFFFISSLDKLSTLFKCFVYNVRTEQLSYLDAIIGELISLGTLG